MPWNLNSGGTPQAHIPYLNQGGSPTECNVYVNQGGTAVQVHSVVTFLEDWNDGTTDWTVLSSSGSIGTQSTEPVSDDAPTADPMPSDVYGYVYVSGGFAAAENFGIKTEPDSYYELFLRSGGGNAGNSESQLQFSCQQQNAASPNERYRIVIYNGSDQANVEKNNGSGWITIDANGSVTVDGTEWCRVQLYCPPTAGGTLEARIENITTGGGPWTVSGNDSDPFGQGGIRISTYEGSGGNRTDMDGFREISGFTL